MKKSKNAKQTVTIEVENCDVFEMHEQKKELVKLLWKTPNSKLWGIVHLMDFIDDKYYYMDADKQDAIRSKKK